METKTTNKRYKTGFALSGGFIKGFAHLGVVQALFEYGIRPDIISGVSAGALAGAFIADGREPYEVVQLFDDHKFMDLTGFARSIKGLFKMDDFIDFLRSNLSTTRIENLKIPYVVTASDLDHGMSVQFRKGDLPLCIAASCCMPVLFAPVNINGTNYVDGGVFKNLPVTTIRQECEKVIAINLSVINAKEYKKNAVSIATRCYNFMFCGNATMDKELADAVIEPKGLEIYSNRELEKAGEIFQQGYKQGKEQLELLFGKNGSSRTVI